MAADRTVTVRLTAIVDGWKRAMSDAGKSVDDLGGKTKKTTKDADKSLKDVGKSAAVSGRAMAVGLAAGAYAAYKLADAAGDLNETQSKTNQVFGDSAATLSQWSTDAAESMGQSKRAALDAASTFGVFGKSAGLVGDDLVSFSTGLTTLGSDLASFSNTSPQEAIDALGSALRGESEPIRRYGVLLDDATLKAQAMKMGLISTTKEALTPQQRVLAAYQAILAQTGTQQGDFARTSDGLANSQRITAAEFENAKTKLGEQLVPVMTAAQHAATGLLGAFNAMPGPMRTVVVDALALGVGLAYIAPKARAAKASLLELRAAQATTGTASLGMRGALTGAASFMTGPWGLAIAGGITALGYFASSHKGASEEVKALTDNLTFQNGVLDENSRKTLAATLAQKGLFNATGQLGIAEKDVLDAIIAGGPALDDLQERLIAIEQANVIAGTGTDVYNSSLTETGQTAATASGIVADYAGSVSESAKSSEQADRATKTLGGSYQDTTVDVAALNVEIAKQIGLLEDEATSALDVADAEQQFRDSVREVREKLLALNEAIRLHGKGSKAATLAQEAYDQSVRDATRSAIDSAKKTRDEATAKALAAGKTEDVAAANEAYRGELEKLRRKTAKGSPLRKNLNELINDLDALATDRSATITLTVSQRAQRTHHQTSADAGGHAAGGLITGYGTGTSDSIPTNLSNGEFVMKAAAVRRIGVGTLSAMNAGGTTGGTPALSLTMNVDARGATMTRGEYEQISRKAAGDMLGQLVTQLRAS